MTAELASRRVLVVDDDDEMRAAIGSLLRAMGQRVREAENGTRGLELILTERPDLALVDIGMLDLDGYELVRRVRATPGGESLFVVAMTGHARSEDRELALSAGFDTHLVKPFDDRELLELLERRAPT